MAKLDEYGEKHFMHHLKEASTAAGPFTIPTIRVVDAEGRFLFYFESISVPRSGDLIEEQREGEDRFYHVIANAKWTIADMEDEMPSEERWLGIITVTVQKVRPVDAC